MRIKKLPRILALHLKRFKYFEVFKQYKKLSYRVVFPFELRLLNTVGQTILDWNETNASLAFLVRRLYKQRSNLWSCLFGCSLRYRTESWPLHCRCEARWVLVGVWRRNCWCKCSKFFFALNIFSNWFFISSATRSVQFRRILRRFTRLGPSIRDQLHSILWESRFLIKNEFLFG